jgi:hypothetical protein
MALSQHLATLQYEINARATSQHTAAASDQPRSAPRLFARLGAAASGVQQCDVTDCTSHLVHTGRLVHGLQASSV